MYEARVLMRIPLSSLEDEDNAAGILAALVKDYHAVKMAAEVQDSTGSRDLEVRALLRERGYAELLSTLKDFMDKYKDYVTVIVIRSW